MSDLNVSRRRLLKTTAIVGGGIAILGAGLLGLRGCQGGLEEEVVDGLAGPGNEAGPYPVWREMQARLRASPDHASGRAQVLLEAGDVAALHRFVRDEIRLVPARGDRFQLGSVVHWGRRAALRAGAGTAREKAEILAELIRKTGREAEVVETDTLDRDEAAAAFFRDVDAEFDPPIEPGTMENWRRRLGERPPETVTADLRAQEDRVVATRDELAELIEQQGVPRDWSRYDDRAYGRVPLVRFREAGGEFLYADPVRPGTEISATAGRIREASPPEGILPVEVSLAFATMDEPERLVQIARAQWTAEDVCGRQVKIGFKPAQGMAELLASRVGDLRTFTPFLSIQTLDGEEIAIEKAVVMGETFTLSGDVLSVDEDGSVTLNGEATGPVAPSGLAGGVAGMDIEVDATRYPDMRLLVWPRDADGRVVDGLNSGDFAVADQGQGMPHLLRVQNRAPRILFLSDSSLSMPGEFRGDDGEAMLALVDRVREAARQVHPDASVTVRATNSNLWENVIKTVGTQVDLIVYATDGHVKGWIPTDEERAPLAMGPKIIAMNVRGNLDRLRSRSQSNVFDEMAELTNGQALDVVDGDASAIEAAIVEFLELEGRDLPYQLGYHVAGGKPGMRTASVSVGSVAGSAEYQAAASVLPPSVMASLRMTVTVGERRVERVIGGHAVLGAVSQTDIDHLCGAVLGTHLLAFEGPPPSFSTIMDDVLTARLSLEKLDRAAAEEDGMLTVIEALEEGHHVLPGELATLMMRTGPLAGEGFCFAEQGMRCAYYASHPILNDDRITTRVDIMPTSRTFVISPDSSKMVPTAFEAGLRLAAAEAALFPGGNTFDLLEGKTLGPFSANLNAQNGLSAEQVADWEASEERLEGIFPRPGHVRFCSQDQSTQASWVVDLETAEVYALLPNLSGGGERARRIEQQLAELDRVVSMLNLLSQGVGAAGVLNPVGAHSLAMVAAYGQNLARIYAAASMGIILMDTRGIEPAVRLAIASMACENVKGIALGVFGGAGKSANRAVEVFSMAESVAGAAGANSPFSCPM